MVLGVCFLGLCFVWVGNCVDFDLECLGVLLSFRFYFRVDGMYILCFNFQGVVNLTACWICRLQVFC